MRRLLLSGMLFIASGVAFAQQPSPIPADIGERIATGFIRPAVDTLMMAATSQRSYIYELCDMPSADALKAARDEFGQLAPALGRLSVLRFGPLFDEYYFDRIFFWPDQRGVTLRQVQGVLAENDPSATDPDTLAGKSVAVQGLPALEYLLFGSGSDELATTSAAFRCAYARAISNNVLLMIEDVEMSWREVTSLVDSFVAPAADKDPYRSAGEVAGEIVKAMSTALQFTRTAELLPALGETPDDARGKRAPFWRSDLTFDFVEAQIGGMIELLDASEFAAAEEPLVRDLANSIRFELHNAQTALEAVDVPSESAFADEEARGRIKFAMIALEGANQILSERFSAAIGLTMGFNALDGD